MTLRKQLLERHPDSRRTRLLLNDYWRLLRQRATPDLVLDMAHLYGRYLNQPDSGLWLLKQYQSLFQQGKKRYDFYLLQGDLYRWQGNLDDAILAYMRAEQEAPSPEGRIEALWRLAQSAYWKHDFGWALFQLERIKGGADRLRANDAIALSFFIEEYAPGGDTTQALPLMLFASAEYCLERRDTLCFNQMLDSLHSLFPQHQLNAEALFLKGRAALLAGDTARALHFWQQLVDQDPTLLLVDDALYELVRLNIEKGRRQEALRWFRLLSQYHYDSPYRLKAAHLLQQVM